MLPFQDGLRVREPSVNPRRTTIVRLLRDEYTADRGSDVPTVLAEQLLAVDEAGAAGVLAESGHGLGFRHPLIRAAPYDEMPAPVRAAWRKPACGCDFFRPDLVVCRERHGTSARYRRTHHRPDGERASVRHVLRALTVPIAGKRSTATAGELHGERDDGEEIHLELLAWLGLAPDPFGRNPPGLRQAFLDWR